MPECECGSIFSNYVDLRQHRADADHWMADDSWITSGRGPSSDGSSLL